MPSIDERVVSMAFENAKFEAGVAKTMATLSKLSESLKKVGATNSLGDIEKAANKVTLSQPMSLLDKLKARLFGAGKDAAEGFGEIDKAGNKVTLTAPMTALDKLKARLFGAGKGAAEGMGDIENAGNRVTLSGPMSALDKLRTRLFGAGKGAAEGMGDIESAGNKVTLDGPIRALDKVQSRTAQVGVNAADGFNEIERASNRVELRGLNSALDSVTAKFSVLQGAATVALGNIVSQATAKGLSFVKSFGFGPIMDGLHEYETNLKSIQTIQANTDRPLTEINASLEELNRYSDQTIYNFSEMARNIGTFTAAGVDLKTATSSIKGIANMAALSGSSSQQAATAMYQLSQAISSGRVSLQDWNSVVNAGMGGKKLQTALATTAIAMGDIDKSSVKLTGSMKKLTINGQSFRESIMAQPGKESWLSSEILVNTLATLDGRFSKAALSAELTADGLKKYTSAQVDAKIAANRLALEQKSGVKYTDEQFKALMKLSDSAFKSATEVKTLGQVFEVARETIGSGWSASFRNIFGNLTEAKSTFTGLSNAINGFINANALARNTALSDWKKLGGRTDLIEGIKNAFKALIAIVKPVGDAFREVFPRKTGEDLADMTKKFRDFTEKLKIGPETANNLKSTFKGFFAVLSIGKTIVGEILGVIGKLFGAATNGSGGFLALTGGVGEFLASVDQAIKKGKGLHKFFDGLGSVLAAPIKLLGKLGEALAGVFSGGDSNGASSSLAGMEETLSPLTRAVNVLKKAWEGLLDVMGGLKGTVGKVVSEVTKVFGEFGRMAGDALQNADFSGFFQILQTTLIGGIFLSIKKALGGGFSVELGGGVVEKMQEALGGLTGSLKAMQTNIKANTLLQIASAVTVLAAGVVALSTVDPKRLTSAMTGVAVGLGQLVGAMALLTKIGGSATFLTMPVIAGSIIMLAGAVDVLAIAVFAFSKLDWEEIGKGLAGVGGSLVAIGVGVRAIPPSVALIGPALLPIALALTGIALAVKIFSTMDWNGIAKGLVGVGGGLTAIGLGTKMIGPSVLLIGPGLIGVAVALTLLSGAVLSFGSMDLEKMGKGLVGVAGSLAAIGVAIGLIPPTIALQAAGLVILGIALTGIAGAIALMGGMDIGKIGKGLATIGASLVIFAGGLTLMAGTIPGTIALMGAATALAVLAPTLGILGTMKWGTIAKGLAAIAALLGVISVVGLVAAPALTALGVALIALGAGVALVGGGVYLLTTGLVKLGADGAKGIGVLVASLTAFVAILPKVAIDFARGLVQITAEVAKLAPKVAESLAKILITLLDVVIKAAPKMAAAFTALIQAGITVIDQNFGPLVDAGFRMLLALLGGISNNIGKVVQQAGNIVVNFLNELARQLPRIMNAGANALVKFLEGIARNMAKVVTSGAKVIVEFLEGIAKEMPKVVPAAAKVIVSFVKGITSKLGDLVRAGADFIVRLLQGITREMPKLASAAVSLISKFVIEIGENAPKLASAGAKAVIKFIEGTAQAIRNNSEQMGSAAADLGLAIIEGMIRGIGGAAERLYGKIRGVVNKALGLFKKIPLINSPSKVTMADGASLIEGLILGISNSAPGAYSSAEKTALGVLSAFKTAFEIQSPSRVMKRIGGYLGDGLAEGLVGSRESVKAALDRVNTDIVDAITRTQDILLAAKNERKRLRDEHKKDTEAYKTAGKTIKQETDNLELLLAAHTKLTKGLKASKTELLGLASQYDDVSARLKESIRLRDELKKSLTDTYSTLPDINYEVDDQATPYRDLLKNRIAEVKKYRETLDKLKALGLDNQTYQKLIDEGTKAQTFADQLLDGGPDMIQAINKLDEELVKEAAIFATSAARNLYDVGVNGAKGLIEGLQSQLSEIRKAMEKIATDMVKAIRKKLRIKSPSQEFADVGRFSAKGMAQGLSNGSRVVTDAAEAIGDDVLTAMERSMAQVSEAMSANLDASPTITPVLDLSEVEAEARRLSDLTNVTPITAAASFGQAASISSEQEAARTEAIAAAQQPTEIRFEQNNYSPESLTPTEIYRQTRNQLAQARNALGLVS